MNKSTTPISTLSLNRSSYEDHPIFEWFQKNGSKIFYTSLLLATLLFITYRYISNQNTLAEQDFFRAANAVVSLQNPNKAESALNDLQLIMHKHPELNAKYDGIIAQDLLLANDLASANLYAQKNFQRVSTDLSSLFLSYSKNSFLIAENKWAEALTNAKKLKADLIEKIKSPSEHFEPKLYLFNLIRIGMLERSLSLHEEEQRTWEELIQIGKNGSSLPVKPADFELVMKHFEMEGVTFMDFIKEIRS